MGTVLGTIILALGLVVIARVIIYPPMLGFVQDLSIGFAGVMMGAIIIYGARRVG
jgi:hypothetical protein